jgi:hypothetical protein
MANFTSETVTVIRYRYILDTPTNPVEVEKMVGAAWQAWSAVATGIRGDDSITVDVEDGQIVAWWEQET